MLTQTSRKSYPSDLTDAQWEVLAPFIPEPSKDATLPTIPRREIVNGILYVLRTGASWRQMPHDLPNGKTVHFYFRLWSKQGIWKQAMDALRPQARREMGREAEPSAAIIDSQSIKTSPVRGSERGFDGGKKSMGSQARSARGYPGLSARGPCAGSQYR
jgi:transposase